MDDEKVLHLAVFKDDGSTEIAYELHPADAFNESLRKKTIKEFYRLFRFHIFAEDAEKYQEEPLICVGEVGGIKIYCKE